MNSTRLRQGLGKIGATIRATGGATVFVALVLFVLPLSPQADASFGSRMESASKTLAVLGDSIVTGAGASDEFEATFTTVARLSLFHGFNFPENSFSMTVARGLGVKPEHVVNLGMNGWRTDSMAVQYQGLAKKTGKVPDYLLISFNGNDACRESVFQTSVDQFRQNYLRTLLVGVDGKGGLRSIVKTAPIVRDTSIYLLASLNFPQVLTNPAILQKEVPLHFSTVRCERFRRGAHEDGPRIAYLANRSYQMCRGILGTDPKAQDVISVFRREHLRQIHRAMVESQQTAIEILKNENRNPRLKLQFIEAPSQIIFAGEHIANDCFHLSQSGQNLLGRLIWEEMSLE